MLRRAAFTLVELLVVITIIAVLLALLLPGLGAAVEQSNRTVDMSRMHQIAAACLGYTTDHFGQYPYSRRHNWGQDHFRTWYPMDMWNFLKTYGVSDEMGSCIEVNYVAGAPLRDPGLSAANQLLDTAIGLIFWANREDLLPDAGTNSQGYITPKTVNGHYSPSSDTLVTCMIEDTQLPPAFWPGAAPHVPSQGFIDIPRNSPFEPRPAGVAIGYLDASAAFVGFDQLTPIREVHPAATNGTLFYHKR
jgi:prepilin-type N-terminal cleavage/methylation domain-containing protein